MTRTAAALARDRQLATDRQRRYLERKNTRRHIDVDELAVTCWCEAVIIHVPRTLVLAGQTDTCGRRTCTPTRTAA